MIKVPCIVGPTGVGKTEISVKMALKYKTEIISADSRQIYKYMDIGTDKPSKELQKIVKFHLIDIITPDKIYSAGDYAREALGIIKKLYSKSKRFILVGGSGLYIKALFSPLFQDIGRDEKLRQRLEKLSTYKLYQKLKKIDPESFRRIHPNDRQRIIRALEVYEITGIPISVQWKKSNPEEELSPFYIGLTLRRSLLYSRIYDRFEEMIKKGFIEEVKRLKKLGYSKDLYAFNAVGYKEILEYLEGRVSLEKAIKEAKRRTKEYARRQLIWFRKQLGIRWIDCEDRKEAEKKIEGLLLRIWERNKRL